VIELPVERPPERIMQELMPGGARILSLNPMHESLEDFFLDRVEGAARSEPSRRASA